MIIGTPETIPVEHSTGYHGGKGPFSRRTLLSDVPGSVFKYVRDITIPAGSIIAEHTHIGDEEVYFVISGSGIMIVDGEECGLGPGSAVLTMTGSTHGIRNEGTEDLRIFVACARVAS
jgi:mannose-6-phosphate isomerase-like protein (cupin superfamily)